MSHIFIFGLGYCATRLAGHLRAQGWQVTGTARRTRHGAIGFEDCDAVRSTLRMATHILSSVPPTDEGIDPVLRLYRDDIATAPAKWIGYLSSTGVYGDVHGAWVDESAVIGHGRRKARTGADLNWQHLREGVRIFRLPGIYGPDRSIFDRIRAAKAHRIVSPSQVFSRIHVDDIVTALVASFYGPAGVFNMADDFPCSQNHLVEHGCKLLGVEPPPILSLDEAALSPEARAFYSENRRVSNAKAKRLLGWRPCYRDYREGLAAILLESTLT